MRKAQHIATHDNTLMQHTATHCNALKNAASWPVDHIATHSYALQHIHCNKVTATHRNLTSVQSVIYWTDVRFLYIYTPHYTTLYATHI